MSNSAFEARQRARNAALQALYQWQLNGTSPTEIEVYFLAHVGTDDTGLDIQAVDRPYFSKLLKGVVEQADELDALLATTLDRPPQRLTPVEHAILYIGCYELKHCIDVPYQVAINEGVELAKEFGAQDAYKYVNGVLDKLSKQLRQAERQG